MKFACQLKKAEECSKDQWSSAKQERKFKNLFIIHGKHCQCVSKVSVRSGGICIQRKYFIYH